MTSIRELRVPELGDFKDVDVVEVLVKVGDQVETSDSIFVVETDKASMDIPFTESGTLVSMSIKPGDKINEGDLIGTLEPAASAAKPSESAAPKKAAPEAQVPAPAPTPISSESGTYDYQVLVLGAGPGGYTAAFRAADLGLKTVLVERYADLGGVCLNVGCIPSKALLHVAKVLDEAEHASNFGVQFKKPSIDLDQLRSWKDGIVKRLSGGVTQLARTRKVDVVEGEGKFSSAHTVTVTGPKGTRTISFEKAIIAAGSQVVKIPGFPYEDSRLISSTGALALADVPKRMLVIGGGIIGLEMSCVYDALGSKITVVELMDRLIPGADKDLVRPLHKRIAARYENIYLKTKVTAIESSKEGLKVSFEGEGAPAQDTFDKVLLAVGRRPNGKLIGADQAGIQVNDRGFIPVDKQQRTNVPHIFAIGDIVGDPMLAHKASHEGRVAAEVAASEKSAFDAAVIPSVAYTDPEIAWVGKTEDQAKAEGIRYGKGVFPWSASGRSLALGRDEGLTKLLFDEETHRVIGAGAVGPGAGELIAEAGLAIEMGCDAADIGLTIHAHPTLSETLGLAAEAFEGTITDLYLPKKKK